MANNDLKKNKKPNVIVGNIGLYYACYELSKRGWNVLPTSRNTKGIDIVIFDYQNKIHHSIQVKTLTKNDPLPSGDPKNIIAAFYFICRNYDKEIPEIFIATNKEISNLTIKRTKNNKESYWIHTKDYEQFKNQWEKIGTGNV